MKILSILSYLIVSSALSLEFYYLFALREKIAAVGSAINGAIPLGVTIQDASTKLLIISLALIGILLGISSLYKTASHPRLTFSSVCVGIAAITITLSDPFLLLYSH